MKKRVSQIQRNELKKKKEDRQQLEKLLKRVELLEKRIIKLENEKKI